jgi:DeoR family transcriptional regulator, fructose operon transcriptional repressor
MCPFGSDRRASPTSGAFISLPGRVSGAFSQERTDPGAALYAIQRHTWLVERARADGRVEVARTSAELAVAPETIRRDLNELERQGLLRRVHGGAVPVERLGFEGNIRRRAARNHPEKERIARAAVGLLRNADSVYFDEGSTVQLFADALQVEHPLTAVTNSILTAAVLAGRRNVTVILLGGRVRPRTLGTLGHWAIGTLSDLVIDVAIMGANGVSTERGLTCPGADVAAIKQAACESARRRVLLADHTKLGAESFCRFARLRDIEALVTDKGAEARHVRAIRGAGVDVVLA